MSSDPSLVPSSTLDRILTLALERPPTLGPARLLCVDGPAGSGKTTLGEALVAGARHRVASARLLHMDDLYEGWDGLGRAGSRLRDDVIGPLAEGRSGSYRRWDWAADAWAETRPVDPVALLVVEGVGSGASELGERIGVLVWVEAPEGLRIERGLARDGEAMRGRWEQWLRAEEAHFAVHRTRERADLVVDAHGRLITDPG